MAIVTAMTGFGLLKARSREPSRLLLGKAAFLEIFNCEERMLSISECKELFEYLSEYIENQNCDLKKQFTSNNEIDSWLIKWEKALKQEKKTKTKIRESMLKVNPAYIPRNHQVEKAIYEALNNYDYSYMDRLTLLLEKPYDYKPENIEFIIPPENGNQNYQTFCGTWSKFFLSYRL